MHFCCATARSRVRNRTGVLLLYEKVTRTLIHYLPLHTPPPPPTGQQSSFVFKPPLPAGLPAPRRRSIRSRPLRAR
jgi:hypothetical protein